MPGRSRKGQNAGVTVPYRKVYDEKKAGVSAGAGAGAGWVHRAAGGRLARGLRGIPRSESIVDIPCGAGRMTRELARLGFSPAAADVSPAMVERARAAFAREGLAVPLEVRDLEDTGWPDGAFDNLLAFRFFHHLPTRELRERVAAEMCRVARKRVLVTYLDRRAATPRRRALAHRLFGAKPGKLALHPREMAELFRKRGFLPVRDLARFPFVHSLRLLVAERALTPGKVTYGGGSEL